MPTLHIRKQTLNQNAYQYTRVQDRNTGMALTAYLMSRLLFLLHAFISFHFLSCLCVCYYICLYFGKAAFHGCPIKCLSLSLWKSKFSMGRSRVSLHDLDKNAVVMLDPNWLINERLCMTCHAIEDEEHFVDTCMIWRGFYRYPIIR